MFSEARDALLKTALSGTPAIQRLGTIHELRVNASERTCGIRIGLIGETSSIDFKLRYDIQNAGGKTEFVVTSMTCEKPWINEILAIALEKRGSFRFEIPGIAAKLASLFL